MTGAREIAEKLTKLRREALLEIGAAGEAGLGFGASALQTRKALRNMGLAERMPSTSRFIVVARDRLTPLGLAVRQILLEEAGR